MKNLLKERACRAIDESRALLYETVRDIAAAPELGYKEFRTSRYMRQRLEALGLPCRDGLARTGLRADAKGRSSRHTVAVIGELDAVVSPAHPDADEATGAAHACGTTSSSPTCWGRPSGLCRAG